MNAMNPEECKVGYYDQQQDLSLARLMIGAAVVGFSIFFWLTVTIFIVGLTIVGVIIVSSEAREKRGSVVTVGSSQHAVDDEGLVRSILVSAYNGSVQAVSGVVASVLSQKNVRDALSDIIVISINRFLDQPDFAERVADISTSVVNPDRRKSAARAVGEDVVPMVKGFVGGVVRGMKKKPKEDKKTDEEKTSKQFSLTSTIEADDDEGEWIEEKAEPAESNDADGSERQP